ncbi:hypothetical protein [Actinomadura sp. B10D3]|uniref:hypothetical protein n=1 Tax=Actinomadura sp. B10D3 TaxID=3153557 RepID=UPI00325D578B
MNGLALTFFAFAGLLLVLALASRRSVWHGTHGWMYRNPEANEPSDAAFGFMRGLYLLLAFLVAMAGVWMMSIDDDKPDPVDRERELSQLSTRFAPPTPSPGPDKARTYSRSEIRAVAMQVKTTIEQQRGSPFVIGPDVIRMVHGASQGNVRINRLRTKEPGTDKFELTNIKKKNPVCLIAKSGASWYFEEASVRNGRCSTGSGDAKSD